MPSPVTRFRAPTWMRLSNFGFGAEVLLLPGRKQGEGQIHGQVAHGSGLAPAVPLHGGIYPLTQPIRIQASPKSGLPPT